MTTLRVRVRWLAKTLALLSFVGIGPAAGCGVPTGTDVQPGEGEPVEQQDEPAANEPNDGQAMPIDELLRGHPDISMMQEVTSEIAGTRAFLLTLRMPADHNDPAGEHFDLRAVLHHRDIDAPVVIEATGYGLFLDVIGQWASEPMEILDANQLTVEHRFFGTSLPDNADWSLLTVRQAAYDHHRTVEILRDLYRGALITTGGSKGGMTALIHKHFFPDDVQGVVAYVAPFSFAQADPRYVDYIQTIGTAACRERIWADQAGLLEAIDPLIDELAPGGADPEHLAIAVSLLATGLEWEFWQYATLAECSFRFLGPGASTDELIDHYALRNLADVDPTLPAPYDPQRTPYRYQVLAELGNAMTNIEHLEALDTELFDDLNGAQGTPWEDALPTYDPTVIAAITAALANDNDRLMLVYGENDPWTGGALELGSSADSHRFTVEGANHFAELSQLGEQDRAAAAEVLERWAGVDALLGPQLSTGLTVGAPPLLDGGDRRAAVRALLDPGWH